MTKERYSQIRQRNNFLFNYYLEEGGKIKDINNFNKTFDSWFRLYKQVNPQQGKILVTQYLDKKHQYVL